MVGGHIYTTDAALAKGTTLAQTQAAIEKANTLRQRPGNLAYRELGTHVTHSSVSPYSGKPSMVIDGGSGSSAPTLMVTVATDDLLPPGSSA